MMQGQGLLGLCTARSRPYGRQITSLHFSTPTCFIIPWRTEAYNGRHVNGLCWNNFAVVLDNIILHLIILHSVKHGSARQDAWGLASARVFTAAMFRGL